MIEQANALKDLTGKRFGFWIVETRAPRDGRNHTRWHCRCATCGFSAIRRSTHLHSGKFDKCFGTHGRAGQSKENKHKKLPGYANGTETFGRYRQAARKRGISFDLTRAEFDGLSKGACHYCGSPPSQVTNRRHFNGPYIYNGIDRKNPAIGYRADNCLSCCGTCNAMKSAMPYDEFLRRVGVIYRRLIVEERT